MNIYEKLSNIQAELKAPKGQDNTFGHYKYRSCEDILEAVKPLCIKNKVVLTISDTLEHIGDRYYIQANATLTDIENIENVTNKYVGSLAYAREEETKKGMDGSQITGTASSYARKYALNGLFCIDDTKDADTDAYKKQQDKGKAATVTDEEYDEAFYKQNDLVTDKEVQMLRKMLQQSTPELTLKNINGVLSKYNKFKLEELLMTEYVEILHLIENLKKKKEVK
jgi:hypothetical protein